MELRRVVPVWRRLARIGGPLRQPDGSARPIERVVVFRQGRPEADLDPRSDLAVDALRLDHGGRSVAFGLELEPHAAGDHGEEPPDASTAPATTRRPLPSAPRVGRRRSLVDDQRTVDAEQARDFIRIEAGAFVLDEISAFDFAARHARPVSSALSASSFRTRRRSRLGGTPAFCCRPSTVRKVVQSWRSNLRF